MHSIGETLRQPDWESLDTAARKAAHAIALAEAQLAAVATMAKKQQRAIAKLRDQKQPTTGAIAMLHELELLFDRRKERLYALLTSAKVPPWRLN
jgi:hypothetical protein